MTTTDPARTAARPRTTGGGWFRAFWRWHFYAAFLVVPVLLVLATTGLVYLLRFQLEPLLHADRMKVEQPDGMDFTQPYDAQLAAVEREYPDATVMSMTEPAGPDRSTVFSVVLEDGSPRDVFVSPWGADVLGALNPDTTLSGYAVRLHADLMAGTLGDRVTELAACWAIVMALTGYVLFWKGRVARRRRRASGGPGARLRSTHARLGSVVGVGVLMLLVSGLPWTGVLGAKAQELATAGGSSLWSTDPGAVSSPTSRLDESLPHSHAHEVPWGMGASEVPRSQPRGEPREGTGHAAVANIDTAVTVADQAWLRHPMTVALPTSGGAGGRGSHGGGGGSDVFSVIGYAFDAPTDERTVHVDRWSGEVVSAYGFEDYPALAKVVSHGIGLHEGRSLGPWSFWGALLMCVGVVAMCLTGPLMWWRRRPSGQLGAPRGRMPLRGSPLLLGGLVVLGVVLPLFGLSLLVVLALDHVVVRRVPALAGWFGSA